MQSKEKMRKQGIFYLKNPERTELAMKDFL